MAGQVARLESLLAPLAQRNGLELVAVETAGGSGQEIIRVFLDRDGGIDMDAIVAANAWVTEALENEGMPEGSYTLEVSSPGIERPLRTREDYERFTGSEAALKTRRIDGRSSFTGTLCGVDADCVLMDVDGTDQRIPLEAVKKAHLKVDIRIEDEGGGADA